MRNLIIVLGDQLDPESSAFDGADPVQDSVWMAEVDEENTYVPAHKQRILLFLSAMRHFRQELERAGWTIHYHALTARKSDDRGQTHADVLERDLKRFNPGKLILTEPGDYRILQQFRESAERAGIDIEIREDRHYPQILTE